MKLTVTPLAATAALQEILKHPSPVCKEALKVMYPTLCITLLCQISYTVHIKPQEIDYYWRASMQDKTPTPPIPLRAAITTLQTLIRRVSSGDQALIMNKRRGSELLCHLATHQKGLTVFAKAVVRNEGCEHMLPYLMSILDSKETTVHIIAMTFLVELLQQMSFKAELEEVIIQYLRKQLNATQFLLRSLAMDGLLSLSTHPEKMIRLVPTLPDVLAKLKDVNRNVNVKALKLLPCLLKNLTQEEANAVALDVASKILPLVDDLRRYRDQGESIFMDQAFAFLDNPRPSLHEAAVKLLEIIAQETKHKSTVTAIATVMNLMSMETKPSILSVVASEIVENVTYQDSISGTPLERWFDRITMICRR
ncbi:maestro heat-like repeat-containing protein family member 7 isoform X1 [Erythrolamprus reginae]|uniref:maestro heat-like repeat-containing protein family member 7 isoform X1 n=1 Tax=Erythrolamprus reginae TaxID=121349 RepID=UPI00396C84F8